ncbi:MAG: FecR family protein [Nitrospirota bacterium]
MKISCRYIVSVVVAVTALALLTAGLAVAAPVGTFTKVEGKVDILRQSEIAAAPVQAGDPVSLGDAIRTKRNGRAEIQFKDETVIQLAPETRITIDEYSFRGEDTREKGLIGLFRGKMRAIVAKLKATVLPVSRTDAGFNIKTPTAIAGVKGTDFIVYYERGVTGVIFIDGEGFVYNPGQPGKVVTVKGGQASFVLDEADAPLDAQPVSDSFVDPHLKDMPGQSPVTITGSEGGEPAPIDVVLLNSSYMALTDTSMGGAGVPGTGGSSPSFINNPGALPPGPPGGVTNLIPITQTYPALLPTPVSLTITIP